MIQKGNQHYGIKKITNEKRVGVGEEEAEEAEEAEE